jgi:hypothetical protein
MKLKRSIRHIEIEFKPGLLQPYLVSVLGRLNMREPVGHFSTPADLLKCLTGELGIESLSAEKAVTDLRAKGKSQLTVIVRG